MSRLPSSQEIIRSQLSLMETRQHPKKNWKKHPASKTIVEREKTRREQNRKQILMKNVTLLEAEKKNCTSNFEVVSKCLEQKRSEQTQTKPKRTTPVGKRILGPGFLERYGGSSQSSTDKPEEKKKKKKSKILVT
eukprot:TRINITY_DN2599_c0_g2_i1.p1 TRINITY_DN2599_c0_g2~~TRINITY_DN2599_c0_g2_i1.p1  ORF type:complete len:135 (-),score=37.07 TRINITY_DN2599_c0_g2_i1:481-885(-)